MTNATPPASVPLTAAKQFLNLLATRLQDFNGNSEHEAGIQRCRRQLLKATLQIDEGARRHLPAPAIETLFSNALTDCAHAHPQTTGITSGINALLPCAHWIQRQAAQGQDSHFVERHGHALLFGPDTPLRCQSVTLGVAIMEPGVTYPFHQHPPEEFYVVLSEGDWYREGTGWWTPGVGGILYNQPSIRHAMRSGERPLLAIWGLMH